MTVMIEQSLNEMFVERKFLTIYELSQYLGIKKSTIYAWAEAQVLPHYKLGRMVRFKKDEIDSWMESKRKQVVAVSKKTKEILKTVSRPRLDIKSVVQKTIAHEKMRGYTPIPGKSGQIEGSLESRKGG
jgi:excisionase family DNA binding protein